MEWWRVGLALGLPWLAGALWLRGSWRAASNGGAWPLALGYGYMLGLLVVTLLLRLQAALGWPLDFIGPLVVLILLTLPGGWLAWRRARRDANSKSIMMGWRSRPVWQHIVFVLLLLWLGLRLTNLLLEIWWRPLYPWDAWTTWTVRPRVWQEFRQLTPFVGVQQWLADSTRSVYTMDAWTYPYTVPLLTLWPTLAFGVWNETAANLPWLGCALALGLGFYGQARWWGASPSMALLFVWLLLSLPILDTHVALAGYADLWMTAVFSLAALAFFQWVRTGDRYQGLLALLLMLVCPFIKLEGAVWLLLFIPAALVAWLRGWPLGIVTGTVALLTVAWWWVGGVGFTVPGLGEFHLTPELIQAPYLGRFALSYRGSWNPVLKNFFVLASWHLFWYLALVAVVVAVPGLWRDRWRRVMAVFIGSCLLMLFVLFFMTDAQRWAEQYTSINRVFLQFAPVLLFWVLTVFVAPRQPNAKEVPDKPLLIADH